MSNKFASALKPKAQPALETLKTPSNDAKPASPHARPSRKSTKHVGGYFDPAVSKQLREIALTEDSSVQALLAEAIDMIFQSRRKPMIASRSKEK
ncbi:ribbon-helix-helix domain-containing protein [Primorskyibacter sp. 2E233]|uniref:ribbon-helix-helix domain-containing protein n=1 Tax=Primorskyibacter sp. 2E233 TaxID=3413431 RepID=UPI003BF1CBB6